MSQLDIEALKKEWVGVEFEEKSFEIKADAMAEYAKACGEQAPAYTDPSNADFQAPPTFASSLQRGRGLPEDMDTLARQVAFIGAMGNTHCALAPGAMEPLASGMKYFREDFQRHIDGGACPWCDGGAA